MVNNPLRDDAFDTEDNSKIKLIAEKFAEIIDVLGLDLTNDSVKDTPIRVAKMYVNEVFKGLNPKNKPEITVVLKSTHSCISCRGVEDMGSSTFSFVFYGQLKDDQNLKSLLFNSNCA